MPSTSSYPTTRAAAFLSLCLLASAHAAPHVDVLAPIHRVRRAAETYNGCYSASTGLSEVGTDPFMSTGLCGQKCGTQSVMGLTSGNDCFCGNAFPPASDKVDDSKCSTPCFGYGSVNCGGSGFWSVYQTGQGSVQPQAAGSSSSSSSAGAASSPSSSSSSSTAEAATSTLDSANTPTDTPGGAQALQTIVTSVAPGTTIVVTQPAAHTATATATATPSGKSNGGGGSNTAGIAAGVVVGVVAAAAIAAAIFFFLRRRQRSQAEEDYKNRTAAQSTSMRQESKPPGTGYSAASDQRLDPSFGRRNSVGSMADSQDYSRRILRVANPDGN